MEVSLQSKNTNILTYIKCVHKYVNIPNQYILSTLPIKEKRKENSNNKHIKFSINALSLDLSILFFSLGMYMEKQRLYQEVHRRI